jgi:hypothetical protein
MNSAFKAATGQYLAYKNIAETLSHNQRVTRLYRVRARALCSLLYAAPPPTDPCRGGALIINSHPPLSPSYPLPPPTHEQASLRMLVTWWPERDMMNHQAALIRDAFEANREASVASGAGKRLIRETEETLELWTHPDIYKNPYMPGSSKFMRNAPPPLEAVFPHGIPADIAAKVIPIHPDGIPYS